MASFLYVARETASGRKTSPALTTTRPIVRKAQAMQRFLSVPLSGVLLLAAALLVPPAARAADVSVPILVPVTGFLALEGQSQRNGAQLALAKPFDQSFAHQRCIHGFPSLD